jgi:hypothetical protein
MRRLGDVVDEIDSMISRLRITLKIEGSVEEIMNGGKGNWERVNTCSGLSVYLL